MPHRPALAGETRAPYRRGGRDGGRRDPARRRRTAPRRSRSTTRRARRWSICARPCAPARRKSGRRRRAISRSTGPASPPIPTPMRQEVDRIIAVRQARRAGLAGPPAHPGRLDGAARRHRELRSGRTRAISCASARRARAHCATALLAILGVPNQRLRVITEDVGGAFGLKTGPYPEYLAMLVAARKIGRPVHWMSSRAEAFLSDNHARDAYSDVELALDEQRQVPGAAHPPPRQHGRLSSARSAPTSRP